MAGNFADKATEEAFEWLTRRGSVQAGMLEGAMRNYEHPVYDPADVGRHLSRALAAPMGGFTGNPSKVQMVTLAVAVIGHAAANGWDTVLEPGS